MGFSMIPTDPLLTELQRLVKSLKADLFERLREHPEIDDKVRAEAFTPVEQGGRTAQAYEVWRDDYLEQVAVAWVLACVFVRYMEDNGLIAETYLAGITPDRRRQAEDAHAGVLQRPPATTATATTCSTSSAGSARSRRRATCSPRARRRSGPSGPPATARAALLAFWREIDPETGDLLALVAWSRGATRGSWATCTRTSPRRPARSTRCCRRRSSSRSSSSTTR